MEQHDIAEAGQMNSVRSFHPHEHAAARFDTSARKDVQELSKPAPKARKVE